MAKTLNFSAKYTKIVVEDVEYNPSKDGTVLVENELHLDALLRLGCTDPDSVITVAPTVAPVAPTSAPEAPAATDIAPEAEEAPETPSEPTPDTPDGEWKRSDIVDWLQERGVAVPPTITKANALIAVKDFLNSDEG